MQRVQTGHCVCGGAQGFKELNLIYFFTAGETEVRCWTIQRGTLAPQAAGVIHSDFERGFIKAEVRARAARARCTAG